jgi:hypothetical protein
MQLSPQRLRLNIPEAGVWALAKIGKTSKRYWAETCPHSNAWFCGGEPLSLTLRTGSAEIAAARKIWHRKRSFVFIGDFTPGEEMRHFPRGFTRSLRTAIAPSCEEYLR